MVGSSLLVNLLLVPLLANFCVVGSLSKKIGHHTAGIIASLCAFVSFAGAVLLFISSEAVDRTFFDILNYWCEKDSGSCFLGVYKGAASDNISVLSISADMYLDKLSKVMIIVITSVSFVVHMYSTQYMSEDENSPRFLAYISLFTFCMLMLVGAKNFLQMFFGWEGVGVCSYLLIGFWHYKESASAAANKAFIVNRVGDCALIIAIMMIWSRSSEPTLDLINLELTQLESIFLFIGCMGKSAQIFLHVWLPDAMEGPTPVSALIHAATMVTAGVFLLARVNIEPSDFIAIIGAATAVLASTTAVAQNDIKKIIAYSTCSQLGYMFMACGVGASQNAMFHLMTHAFFKAMLFLCAGNVIHAIHEQDIRKMGGLIQKMPITYLLFLVGSLAIVGVPPFAGYYSKDAILEAVNAYPVIGENLYMVGLFAAFCTAVYSTKVIVLVFHGHTRVNHVIFDHAHEANAIMLVPKSILFVGAIISGMYGYYLLGITAPNDYLNIGRMGFVYHPYHDHVPLIVGICGCIIGYICYSYKFDAFITKMFRYIHIILAKKYYFDEIYDVLFVLGVKKLTKFSNNLDKAVDVTLVVRNIDYISFINKGVKRIHNGYVVSYAIHILASATLLSGWIVYKYVMF